MCYIQYIIYTMYYIHSILYIKYIHTFLRHSLVPDKELHLVLIFFFHREGMFKSKKVVCIVFILICFCL